MHQKKVTEPDVLYIASVDDDPLNSAEWFSRIRYRLSESHSINRAYRWVCWPFQSLPEALAAISRNPDKEFIYLRIDPSENVLSSYSGGSQQYLKQALEPIKKRNCIVVFEADHTSVDGVPMTKSVRSHDQAKSASDLIKQALEHRSSGKSGLLSARIDDLSAFSRESLKEMRRQITVLTGRCDRIDKDLETIEEAVEAHEHDLKKIRALYGRGKGILGAITRKAIVQGLGLVGAGAGIKWLVDVLMG